MNGRILLVEDDESLGFVTKDQLEQHGFKVIWAKDGDQGLQTFQESPFDLCLLDIMLPNRDGFTLAREIREVDEFVPLLFVTARVMEMDRLHGFEIGGDDYITKPFSMDELIYRVKVFLRRSSGSTAETNGNEIIKIGQFEFDLGNLSVTGVTETIRLTRMEGNLLSLLAKHRNELVKREDILVEIWGENDYFKGRSLDVFISRLRKYLKEDPTIELKNHHGVGFALCY